ncbi:MAG: RDD family protein [Rubellimicrobium sp.]|nr:RDD family protein [Rubellimicrobium sp.]
MRSPGLPDPDREPAFYANVPAKRLAAFVVDGIITLAMALVVLPFTAFLGLFFFPLFWSVIGFIYRVLTLRRGSATWGMRLMALELRESDGLRLRAGTALLHVAGLYLSFLIPPLQVISVLLMAALGRGQGLTDLVLGTAMVNRPA